MRKDQEGLRDRAGPGEAAVLAPIARAGRMEIVQLPGNGMQIARPAAIRRASRATGSWSAVAGRETLRAGE